MRSGWGVLTQIWKLSLPHWFFKTHFPINDLSPKGKHSYMHILSVLLSLGCPIFFNLQMLTRHANLPLWLPIKKSIEIRNKARASKTLFWHFFHFHLSISLFFFLSSNHSFIGNVELLIKNLGALFVVIKKEIYQ